MYLTFRGVVNMANATSASQGCLLGLAVGDALGFTVDSKTLDEICDSYGSNGLLGYDLQNEYADVTSYTQIAAYTANGLLLGATQSGSRLPYLSLGLKEWTRSQHYYRDPERTYCWIAKLPAFRRRNCRDARMLDVLRLRTFGTPDKPSNRDNGPGALTEAVSIGLFYDPRRMTPPQIGELAAKAIALTHGSREAYLSGVVLAYCIAGLMQEPDLPLADQFLAAIQVMEHQFASHEAKELGDSLRQVVEMSRNINRSVREEIEALHCQTAGECLAGAMFASLTCGGDFDTAMVTAVNHSGSSSAVGALTGAILGAKLGIEALPDFYLESIEPRKALMELSQDLLCSTPTTGLYDDDWDQKYVQGEPL